MEGDLTETFNMTGTFLGFSKLQFLLVAPDGELRALSNETNVMVGDRQREGERGGREEEKERESD